MAGVELSSILGLSVSGPPDPDDGRSAAVFRSIWRSISDAIPCKASARSGVEGMEENREVAYGGEEGKCYVGIMVMTEEEIMEHMRENGTNEDSNGQENVTM